MPLTFLSTFITTQSSLFLDNDPETSSRVTLASLGIVFQTNLYLVSIKYITCGNAVT